LITTKLKSRILIEKNKSHIYSSYIKDLNM
jgi:hypothetical protein